MRVEYKVLDLPFGPPEQIGDVLTEHARVGWRLIGRERYDWDNTPWFLLFLERKLRTDGTWIED